MDPNLVKIRNHNMRLIRKGKFRLPLLQARHYLTHILTEYRQDEIDTELNQFELSLQPFMRKKKNHGQEGQRRQEG